MLYFHWDYLNEVQGRPDRPGGLWVLAGTPEDAQRLLQEIDALLRSSDLETRTQATKRFVLDFPGMLGNIKLILLSVSPLAVFAILLIVANTVGMSIRERTAELAILRALGFRRRQVLGLLVGESLVLSLSGAALGCAVAAGLFALTAGYQVGGAMPIHIQVDSASVVLTLAVAVGIALASMALSAWRASRANVAQGLRFVG